MATDDLTPFLLPPPDSAGVRYGQGKLTAWDPDTFQNTVLWRGAALHNLPVLAGPAANSFAAGQVVALIGWAPGGGAGSWAILGQWVTPGAGAAEAQIEFMNSSLAKAISAQILAERIFSADEDGQVNISHTAFGFVSAAGGPSLTDIPITAAGRAIVFASANIGTDTAAAGTEVRGFMSYEVSGASTVAPITRNAVQLDFRNDIDDNGIGISASRASLLTGLNEGLHNFEAKYQVTAFGAGDEAIFLFRNLTVIAF